jgi:hypothetical protein
MVAVPLGFLLQVLLVRFVRGVKRRRVFDSCRDGFVGVLEVCDFARLQRALHFAHNLLCVSFCVSSCVKITEAYCEPTSFPWRFAVVGSWNVKRCDTRSS